MVGNILLVTVKPISWKSLVIRPTRNRVTYGRRVLRSSLGRLVLQFLPVSTLVERLAGRWYRITISTILRNSVIGAAILNSLRMSRVTTFIISR